MEEIYNLPDGSTVDISSYSQFQKTNFLIKNPGAKKSKGTAKSATALPTKKALNQSTDSKQVTGSSVSKKFRLPSEAEISKARRTGVLPPPSTMMFSEGDYNPEDFEYDFKGNFDKKKPKPLPEYKYGKDYKPKHEETKEVYLANKDNTKVKINKPETTTKFVQRYIDKTKVPDPFLNDLKIRQLEREKSRTDSELEHPYLYYSSFNQKKPDSFVKDNFNESELEDMNINAQDFDGFLNKNKYKEDFLDKEQRGLFTEGTGVAGYDEKLAKELQKKRLLTLYMSNIQSRDITRQVINQDIEITKGLRDKRDIKENIIFDDNKLINYVEKNFPIYTQKLKESEAKSRKIYEEAKTGGTDFWSWDTAGKIGNATWNGFTNRIHQFSATVYDKIGMKDVAEYSRFMADQDAVETPDDRSVGYVSGKETYVDGKKYLVSSKGDVYDADLKIRITDLLEPKSREKIYDSSKYGNSSYVFSPQGVAIGTGAIVGDMILQAALTRGVGAFGAVATETRIALSVAGKQTQASQLLNSASSALKMIPIKRSTGYAMVSQGTLGYSQGFEETLKAARENGINDEEAFALASNAAQRMGVLYATTGVINPQTNVVDNLFTAKNLVKKAIEQYTKTGKKGFIQSLDDVIKNTPRNLVDFAEAGVKEVVQEDVQQVGEIALNKITNREAGKKILNEEMTADDFMNTSILSFISSGLISKAKLPNFQVQGSDIDDLTSLSKLAQNKKQFTQTIDGLVDTKVFTIDEANKLKADVDIYSNNINKLPKVVPPSAAMPIMRELDNITKLENEKKSTDKAFHSQIDRKIEEVRSKMLDIQYEGELKEKNEAISRAIKKGIAKGIEMRTFSNREEVKNYLVNEVGMPKEDAELYYTQTGFALNADEIRKYSKDPSSISDNKQIIIVNEGASRDAGVIQHEFLHGLLQKTLKANPEAQKLLGVALNDELFKIQDNINKNKLKGTVVPVEFMEKMEKYFKRNQGDKAKAIGQYQKDVMFADGDVSRIAQIKAEHNDYMKRLDGVMWEEAITVFSDAVRQGYVTYEESTFTKLGDVIRRVLQQLGVVNIKFNNGRDVYNFIKDYNKSVETGNWGRAITKMSNKGAKINIKSKTNEPVKNTKPKEGSKFSTTARFTLSERKSSEDIKKDVNKNYDKDKWGAGSVLGRDENPAIERVLYNILSEYDYIIKGKAKVLNFANTPGYNDMDMISETYIQLMPHIRNFNKEFLQKREEFKKELVGKGLDPNSAEFKQKIEEQDKKGYEGKKGIVKENDDLNAWINSQLVNKMNAAMKSGNVSEEAFTDDIEGEMFKESRIVDGFTGDQSYLEDEGDSVFDSEEDFAQEQNQLAVLLSDPVYRFVDEKGKPIDIETVPFGGFFVTDISDPSIAANIKLRTETDATKIAELNKELKDLERGLELQNKQDITFEEKEELKQLRSFKSYDLSTGMMVNTFKALSIQDTPAKIITDEVGREILRSPNIQTLEYRNFKEKLSTTSKTMARRMTFKNGPEIESLMYNEWALLYDVINHPVDPVTGQSSYASKKLPPTLKETDEKGNFKKINNITRVKFLQAYYGVEEASRIIKTFGGVDAEKELREFEDPELSEKDGKSLRPTTYFDRRTALMELFGDVLVLQEARRLIRNPEFLDRVSQVNVNLYNELKDDVIRASVLNDMSKGKSNVVRFTLSDDKIISGLTDSEIRRYNSLFETGTKLRNNIADNVLFSYDSSPKTNQVIRFTLSDLEKEKSNKVSPFNNTNKKYENNFKPPSSIFEDTDYSEEELIIAKNYYIKALQYSDITDTEPGTKLHTFKYYEDVEKEVIKRVMETLRLLQIFPRTVTNIEDFLDPETGEIDFNFKDNSNNPFVIKDYKEGYVDSMIQKSITQQNESYVKYWTEIKNNPVFRAKEIDKLSYNQYSALKALVDAVYDEDDLHHNGVKIEGQNKFGLYEKGNNNNLKFNPFFTYLFLKDVLSSRYRSNPDTNSSERKPFKKSDYLTTLEPIDTYLDIIIQDVQDNFSDVKSQPGMIYSLININYGKTFSKDWEENRLISREDDISIFKFEAGKDQYKAYSLNRLTANNTNPKGLWCTGQSVSTAVMQLGEGDFYTATDNEYKPIIAIRMDASANYSVAEVDGVGEEQVFKTEDLPLVSKIFLETDLENKESFSNIINEMYNIATQNKEDFEASNNPTVNEDLIRNVKKMTKGGYFIFKLDEKDRNKVLNKADELKKFLTEAGYHGEQVSLGDFVDTGSRHDLNITEESAELLAEQAIITEQELNLDEADDGGIFIYSADENNKLKSSNFVLPYLQEIDYVYFEGASRLFAPQLAKGNLLSVSGRLDMSFDGGYLELPESIDFDVDVMVTLEGTANHFVLSDSDTNFEGRQFTLTTSIELPKELLEEEGTSIDITTVDNTSEILLRGLADVIYLPNNIRSLALQKGSMPNSTKQTMIVGSIDIKELYIESGYTDEGFDPNQFNFVNEKTSIKETFFALNKMPNEALVKNILNSDIGLISEKIVLEGTESFRDDNGVLNFKDFEITVKEPSKGKPNIGKFTLAEEENGKLNPLLKGLPFSKQWVVARDIDNAINKGRAAEGIRIPFSVPSRSKFSDEQTAYFIIQKVAEGFNDFEFRVKKNAKGPLTKQVLDALDIKSKEYQDRAERNNNIERTINEFIEENKGVSAAETFSPETAKNIGKNIGKYEMYLPPEDEDFLGLLYTLAGARGKKVNEQLKFLTDTLLKPYSDAMLNLMKARQTMYKDWQDLINKKHKGISKLLKQDSGYGGYLVDQAVRVYLWSAAGYDIPGLDKKDLFHLREIVRTNPKLRSFASDVSLLSKQANGYTEPDSNWGFGSVVSDINGVISKSNRKKYLEQWQNNVDKAFSKDNMSKIEAVYGRKYVKALRNTLDRMKTGSNRAEGSNDAFLNWLNGATAVTMFTNIRSAFLQTLGAVNYLNTSDNNIVKAGAALLNVPQFLKDFNTIWNSDYSKDRRSGLTNDIAEAELAQVMNDPRNKSVIDKFKAANYWILKKGYGPTRFADSFAIAFGGATFYRNRLNAYTKKGMSEVDAEKETMRDFYEISESSQQSADVSKISMNQASTKGRLLLSFLNTPFQYSRIIKRSVIDLAKGRGDVANNIAKIVYYSTIQNIMFNFLQNALFSIIWDDDDERDEAGNGKFDKAKVRAVSGSLDTLLRGSGLQGVVISTIKNIIIKWYEKSGDPKGYGEVLLEAGNLAPSIGIKLRALAKSYKAVEYNKDEIEYKGFSLDNTYALEALTSLTSAATNVPVDRLMQKFENVSNALNEEYEAWQRVAFAMGYNKWNLGISDEKNVSTNAAGELKIPELKQSELKVPELK